MRRWPAERFRPWLRRTAGAYLSRYELDAPARFDVAEVYCEENGAMRVEYLAGAFE